MTKIVERIDEKKGGRILCEVMERVKNRYQGRFGGSVEVVQARVLDLKNYNYNFLVEVITKKVFWIFSRKKRKVIFYLCSSFLGGGSGERFVKCGIDDAYEIESIAKEELKKCNVDISFTFISEKYV